MYSGTLRNVASLSRRKVDGKRTPVILTFTASATWVVPAGVKKVDVFLVGGGGNGGNAYAEASTAGGGGGGGGGNVVAVPSFSVTPGASVTVTIGAAGGNSSFGTLVAKAGTNGVAASGGYTYNAGGDGNSGGGCSRGNSLTNMFCDGGVQASAYRGNSYVGGYSLIANLATVSRADFNGVLYGNGGGGGNAARWYDGSWNMGSAGAAGSGAGNGGSFGGNGGDGSANSGGGGGGGAGKGFATASPLLAGSGGAGGSGLVQIRYWRE